MLCINIHKGFYIYLSYILYINNIYGHIYMLYIWLSFFQIVEVTYTHTRVLRQVASIPLGLVSVCSSGIFTVAFTLLGT